MNNKFYYTFLPLNLIYDVQYESLSLNAIVLYSLFLNRNKLSLNNPDYNDSNGTFIYFSNPQIQTALRCNQDSARKALNELETAGLIRKEYQKNGLPLKIYVKDIREAYSNTYNPDKPPENPRPKPNRDFKPYSPAPHKEKQVSFDVKKAENIADNGTLDFGEMKIKRRRKRPSSPMI